MDSPNNFQVICVIIGCLAMLKVSCETVSVDSEPSRKMCKKVMRIGFLKIHKCASTTLQGIFLRHAIRHDLNVVLPRTSNELSVYRPFTRSMLNKTIWEKAGLPYHVWALHGRWNYKEVSSLIKSPAEIQHDTMAANNTFMEANGTAAHFSEDLGHVQANQDVIPKENSYNETVFITMLREPMHQFISLWSFFNLGAKFKMTLNNYILKHPKDLLFKRYKKHLGLNQMLFDFGFHIEDPGNKETIEQKIKEIEDTFDLVLIQDKFEESLIIMKERLCWSYQDIAYVTRNEVNYNKKHVKLSLEAVKMLRTLLEPDYILYNHFRKKFYKMMHSIVNMSTKVAALREINVWNEKRCHHVKPNRKQIDLRGVVSEAKMCPLYKFNELNLVFLLRRKFTRKAQRRLGKIKMEAKAQSLKNSYKSFVKSRDSTTAPKHVFLKHIPVTSSFRSSTLSNNGRNS